MYPTNSGQMITFSQTFDWIIYSNQRFDDQISLSEDEDANQQPADNHLPRLVLGHCDT